MTNEEKILDILALMQTDMNSRFDRLENEVAKINIKIENEIEPKLAALAEGQKTLVEGQ